MNNFILLRNGSWKQQFKSVLWLSHSTFFLLWVKERLWILRPLVNKWHSQNVKKYPGLLFKLVGFMIFTSTTMLSNSKKFSLNTSNGFLPCYLGFRKRVHSSAVIKNNSYLLEVLDDAFKLLWALWLHFINQGKTHGRKCKNFSYSVFKIDKSGCKGALLLGKHAAEPWRVSAEPGLAGRVPSDRDLLRRAAGEEALCKSQRMGWPEPRAVGRGVVGCSRCVCKPYSEIPSSRCDFLRWNLYHFIRLLQIAEADASIAPVLPELVDLFWTCGTPREVAAVDMQFNCWVPVQPWTSSFLCKVPSNPSSLANGFTGEERQIVLSFLLVLFSTVSSWCHIKGKENRHSSLLRAPVLGDNKPPGKTTVEKLLEPTSAPGCCDSRAGTDGNTVICRLWQHGGFKSGVIPFALGGDTLF